MNMNPLFTVTTVHALITATNMECGGHTGLVGARLVCLGQNCKYVAKVVGINLENCFKFCWNQTGLVPTRPVRRFMFQT